MQEFGQNNSCADEIFNFVAQKNPEDFSVENKIGV